MGHSLFPEPVLGALFSLFLRAPLTAKIVRDGPRAPRAQSTTQGHATVRRAAPPDQPAKYGSAPLSFLNLHARVVGIRISVSLFTHTYLSRRALAS